MPKNATLEQEINQQPAVVEKLFRQETNSVKRFTEQTRGSFDSILIAARGTSDNAARYAQYLFGAQNRLPVALATPSLFTLYKKPPILKRTLVIAISQSGQSPDILAVVEEATRQNQTTLAITNESSSPLAKAAGHVIYLNAGKEKSTAATKTYTASLAAMALFSSHLASQSNKLDILKKIPVAMANTLVLTKSRLSMMDRYRYMDRLSIIGRGYNYATSYEIAIKIKELTGTQAESYSSADFRHGPIAVVKNGYPVMIIATHGSVASDLQDLVGELLTRGSELIAISDLSGILKSARLALPIANDLPEWLSPLTTVLPGQYFALMLALNKNLNPDQPAGIKKITETY
jgi:glucosamine--fructose-6-phosphate aminotransferase (isomerizing)